MKTKPVIALLLLLFLALNAVSHAQMMLEVDQTNLTVNPDSGFAIVHNQTIAQTFTVGLDGKLAQIDLQAWKTPGTTGSGVTLRLLTTGADGFPDTSLIPLYETVIPLSRIADFGGHLPYEPPIVSVDLLPAGLDVVSGDVLAVSLFRVADANRPWVQWGGKSGDTYVDGYGYSSATGLSPWTRFNNSDTGFRTHVLVPEPSSIVLAFMSVLGLLAFGRRRK